MVERVIIEEEPIIVEEPVDTEVIYVCARCDMEIPGELVWRAGEVYCCPGCTNGTGCTCV